MAELLIFAPQSGHTPQVSGYEDGDILCAFNKTRIQRVHAQHICHYQWAGFNGNGLRPDGSMARKYLDCVYRYRFERLNENQVKRVENDHLGNIIAEEIFGKPEIDVDQFVRRRVKHAKHRVFGEPGAEIWHGGRTQYDADSNSVLWSMIQTDSAHEPSAGPCNHCGQDHSLWTCGRGDITSHLIVQVDEFNELERQAMESQFAKSWQAGETITDPDGTTVNPTWSDEGVWEHPTGKWLYRKDSESNEVSVTFAKRNMKATWVDYVPPAVNYTEGQIRDNTTLVGRQHNLPNPNLTPWTDGRSETYKAADHTPLADETKLTNKADKRAGERIPA